MRTRSLAALEESSARATPAVAAASRRPTIAHTAPRNTSAEATQPTRTATGIDRPAHQASATPTTPQARATSTRRAARPEWSRRPSAVRGLREAWLAGGAASGIARPTLPRRERDETAARNLDPVRRLERPHRLERPGAGFGDHAGRQRAHPLGQRSGEPDPAVPPALGRGSAVRDGKLLDAHVRQAGAREHGFELAR